MPFYPFFLDFTYVFVILGVLITFAAQIWVKAAFSRASRVRIKRGITGADAARSVLRTGDCSFTGTLGTDGVGIAPISGELTDNYNPQTNIISLSQNVYSASTAAAVGVAAHEAGHALQYASGYAPIKLRTAIIPVCNFASKLSMPLFIIGILLSSFAGSGGSVGSFFMYAGIVSFSVAVFFQLVTLPVEFNASRRALAALDATGDYTPDELSAAKSVLSAAAMTYVAALAASLLQILRLLIIASRGRRR